MADRYYHRSDAALEPGTELVPASQRGHVSKWAHLPTYRDDVVYVYRGKKRGPDRWNIHGAFDRLGRYVYLVEPRGELRADPESSRGNRAKMVEGARVVALVHTDPPPPCRQCTIPPGLRGPRFVPHPHEAAA